MRRRNLGAVLAVVVVLSLAAALRPQALSAAPDNNYITSEKCATCHQIQYRGWVKTFHSTVIKDTKADPSAILADMKAPGLPFKKEDIYYAIGGHWDQRFLTKIEDEYYILPRLWSIQSKKWKPYSEYGWQKRPYSRYCVGCHSVAFNPKTREIAEHAVGCESCHGPGARHAKMPIKGTIVNPKRLPTDRRDEICASCHVRGKDLSGVYFFPIAFKPGEELAKYLIPDSKEEGESDYDAIHRLWNKWKSDREKKERTQCAVCGIPGHQTTKSPEKKAKVDEVCMSCHSFEVREHTHHAKEEHVGCSDCHQQKDPELNETKEENVHSYSFFLVHASNCWDKDIYKRCGKCHTDKSEKWAYEVFLSWKRPVTVDH